MDTLSVPRGFVVFCTALSVLPGAANVGITIIGRGGSGHIDTAVVVTVVTVRGRARDNRWVLGRCPPGFPFSALIFLTESLGLEFVPVTTNVCKPINTLEIHFVSLFDQSMGKTYSIAC